MVTQKKVMLYIAFAIFWIGAVFSFLYVPYLFQCFENKKSINVFMWSGVIDTKLLADFEKESGIHVNVSYFEGNEELIVKVLATKGKGYDMIVPSDYAVEFFAEHGLLKKIDKTKLTFWDNINPKFLNHSFDPGNQYSIPAEWYVLGIGMNSNHFPNGLPDASLKTIFEPDPALSYRIGAINDSRELAALAIKYKYGSVRPINAQETQEIKQLLIAQRKRVEAYTDFRGDFLLESGNCSVVLVSISFMWRMLLEDPSMVFVLPKEGTFLGIENYAILEASTKEDLVYQFMNFLFRLDVQQHNFEHKNLLSTRKDATFLFANPTLKMCLDVINSSDDTACRAQPFENVLTDDQVNDLWIAVKGE